MCRSADVLHRWVCTDVQGICADALNKVDCRWQSHTKVKVFWSYLQKSLDKDARGEVVLVVKMLGHSPRLWEAWVWVPPGTTLSLGTVRCLGIILLFPLFKSVRRFNKADYNLHKSSTYHCSATRGEKLGQHTRCISSDPTPFTPRLVQQHLCTFTEVLGSICDYVSTNFQLILYGRHMCGSVLMTAISQVHLCFGCPCKIF